MINSKQTEPLIATYLHAKGGNLGIPVSGTFELTSRCNFSCPMCYVHNNKSNSQNKFSELPADWWISLAHKACDAGMMFVLLTGGEPFIRDDFFDIYDAMKQMGLMISINTNGSLIKGSILQRLLDNPPFRINISLYGGNSDTYINMCKNDAFDDVISSIVSLKEAGVDVRLNLSLTPYNKDDIENIKKIADKYQLHIKFNAYMYPPHRIDSAQNSFSSRLSPMQAAEYTTRWDRIRLDEEAFYNRCRNLTALHAQTDSECISDVDKGPRCRAGRSSFWVTWDGKLLPCGMMKFPCVDLNNADFNDAWDNIRQESTAFTIPAKCITCKKLPVCNICPAVCITETGSFELSPQYVCEYTDALIEIAEEKLTKG